ncbi:MAG: PhnD/SsuA/transferrin family substrate-binding protein [Mesorhizobium sp.]
MSGLIAALPMYDWPERRAEVDAQWAAIRDHLRVGGIDAPEELTRKTDDLYAFWRQHDLFFSQTCWGPMEDGLAEHVQVLGQPSYDGVEGGEGELYSSAIIMRREGVMVDVPAPVTGQATLPLARIRGLRFAYNVPDSMSGFIGISRDLEAAGETISIFNDLVATGGHRASIRAVADGRADVAAIDCLSWKLAQKYEPPAQELVVVGWTAKRKGLPYITANGTSSAAVAALRDALRNARLV